MIPFVDKIIATNRVDGAVHKRRLLFYVGLVLFVLVGAALPQGFKAFKRGDLLRARAGTMIRECFDCALSVEARGTGKKIGEPQSLRAEQWFTWTHANGSNTVEIAGEDYYFLHPAKENGPQFGWDASRVVLAPLDGLSDWRRTFRFSQLSAFLGLFIVLAVCAHHLDKQRSSLVQPR